MSGAAPRRGVDENAAAGLLVDPVALLLGRAALAEAAELQVAVNDTCAPDGAAWGTGGGVLEPEGGARRAV